MSTLHHEIDGPADAPVLVLLGSLGSTVEMWELGGMVGMHLASEHPGRISRLVLCCTSARFPDTTIWTDRIAAVGEHGTGPLAEGVVGRWFTPGWAAAHPDVVTRARGCVTDTPDGGYRACCQAIEVWDHGDRLSAITAPTLVVGGADDLSTPVEPHARTIAAGIPGAHLEVLAGGHLATIESADEASRLIAEHCAD
ncbi:MAG: hypothetical protein OJJ54_19190 [Pseudonocardia sp.]|nr:hypothetical protein [Pseudonocardia sp.]